MTQLSDPADRTLDAAAADTFVPTNRRAGYSDPLGWALRQARKGGTLAAGEGALIVEHYEKLVKEAYNEGGADGFNGLHSWREFCERHSLEAR